MERFKAEKFERPSVCEQPSAEDNKAIGKKTLSVIASKNNIETVKEPWEEYVSTLTDEQILKGEFDAAKLTRNADDFCLDYRLYPVLRKHTEHAIKNGKIVDVHKNIDYIGYTYTRYTGDLINKICGRYEAESNHDEGKNERKKINMDADHVIYLDKSGRPVQYLVDMFWNEFSPKDENGNPHPKPSHSFANLDRISILTNLLGCREVNESNAWQKWEENKGKLNASHFAKLRSLFLKEPLNPEDPSFDSENSLFDPEKIMELPTILDGKKVMIVDEVEFGGLSMEMATFLLKKALPGVEFSGTTFWQDSVEFIKTDDSKKDSEGGFNSKIQVNKVALKALPVWYLSDKNDFRGRGTGDVDVPYYISAYEKAEKDAQEMIAKSSRPLSEEEQKAIVKRVKETRFTEKCGAPFRGKKIDLGPDGEDNEMTRHLTRDMRQLLKDYRAHKIFPWFNPLTTSWRNSEAERAIDDYIIQIVRAGVNPDIENRMEHYREIEKTINSRPPKIY